MTIPTSAPMAMTIVATDPPFNAGHGVLFGLQAKREVDDPVPASRTTEFNIDIEVRTGDSGIDFAGDHVHGRRGDRFVYLSWGLPDPTQPFVMFARAKIKLDGIPQELLDQCAEQDRRLIADVQATNGQGQPATGTIKPPAIRWTIG